MLKLQNPKTFTMHDKDYYEVWRVLEDARAKMTVGQVHQSFICPICGGPAFCFDRQLNNGKDYVGGCECGCWDIWE